MAYGINVDKADPGPSFQIHSHLEWKEENPVKQTESQGETKRTSKVLKQKVFSEGWSGHSAAETSRKIWIE